MRQRGKAVNRNLSMVDNLKANKYIKNEQRRNCSSEMKTINKQTKDKFSEE